ncbi:transposase [Gemmiger formicilis]|uniref:transposase n=1 Tax=Gemmiger formicilis TaxID=745368 RepID=UPI003CED1D11
MENMGYYEPDDCFICKNGRHLDLSSHYTSHAKDGTERKISVYRCEDCSGCPYRAACCKAKDSEKRKEIFVCWEFQNLRKNAYHNITTEEGKLLRCNRSILGMGEAHSFACKSLLWQK